MADFVQIDPVTGNFIVDMPPEYIDGVTAEVKAGPVPSGFIVPRWTGGDPLWIEGATQQQLDDRAAFVAEQSLIELARQRLATLTAAGKNIVGNLAELEAVVMALGKAGYVRSLATRDATLAIAQAYQTWVNNPPTSQNAVTALTALFTAVGTQENNRRQADIAYLAALQDIRDAIDDREGGG